MSFNAGPIRLCDESRTADFADRLAPLLRAGDALLLSGPVGAGKSFFARALIRARLGRPQEDVPSPTFTLVQTYDDGLCEIWHCDLYRLGHPDEAFELGLDAAFEDAICLIEWPDRLGDLAPPTALWLTFSTHGSEHQISLSGTADWAERLVGLDV